MSPQSMDQCLKEDENKSMFDLGPHLFQDPLNPLAGFKSTHLNGGFLQVSKIGGGLSWFLSKCLRTDTAFLIKKYKSFLQ